jgi:integrase
VHEEEGYVRDFLLIALFTGMRRSEIARLRWEFVDFDGRTLTVPTTKNGDPLELPLSSFLFDLLLARRESDPEGDWVFPGRGESGHMVETKKFYARVTRTSGIRFTLHDLRRTFVTIAESLDIPHYALKRLLNHRADNDVTAGYIVIDVERLRGPVERVAERILELAGIGSEAGDVARQAA